MNTLQEIAEESLRETPKSPKAVGSDLTTAQASYAASLMGKLNMVNTPPAARAPAAAAAAEDPYRYMNPGTASFARGLKMPR